MMAGAEHNDQLVRVITIAAGVIAESQAGKQAAANEIMVLNEIEDEARIMMQACKEPAVSGSLDPQKLQAWCTDVKSVESVIASSRSQRIEQTQTLRMLASVSGVTATGSIVPFVAQAASAPNANEVLQLIHSKWLEPQQIAPLIERVRKLLRLTGCDRPWADKGKTTEELLGVAWAHYQLATEETADSMASFMAMRQCIDDVIESLARRRRVKSQLPDPKGQRVAELLQALRLDDAPDGGDHRIADTIEGIRTGLTNSKKVKHNRGSIGLTLREASMWLESLLERVDVAKLRL